MTYRSFAALARQRALHCLGSERMTKILLIRHGHVEGIKPERFRGREPLELTDQGRGEAAAVANRIAGRWQPRSIYTSPLSRCVKTAEAVAEACAVAAQICDDLNIPTTARGSSKPFIRQKPRIQRSSPHGLQRLIWSAFQKANRCKTLPREPPTPYSSCSRAIMMKRLCW
jgi:hypothetical protein